MQASRHYTCSLSFSLSHIHTQTQTLCTYTHVEQASVGGRKREEKCLESPNKIYATNLLSSIIIPVKKNKKNNLKQLIFCIFRIFSFVSSCSLQTLEQSMAYYCIFEVRPGKCEESLLDWFCHSLLVFPHPSFPPIYCCTSSLPSCTFPLRYIWHVLTQTHIVLELFL